MFIINILDIIAKKRDGHTLSKREIDFFVSACSDGSASDCHIAAFITACSINKISKDEMVDFALSMSATGQSFDSAVLGFPAVDVHCTAAVGNKIDLVLTPLLCSAGVNVIRTIDGNFGFICGTSEKLGCISGLRTELSSEELFGILKNTGGVFCSSSGFIAPAERRISSVMKQLPVVSDLSLIAACIISRKLSVSSDAVLFDVRYGSGTVFSTFESAETTAQDMICVLNALNKKSLAVVSPFEEPMGRALGFRLEFCEAVDTLKGHGPEDLTEKCLSLAARALVLIGKEKDYNCAYDSVREILFSGRAVFKLNSIVSAQGGFVNFSKKSLRGDDMLMSYDIKSEYEGYICHLDSEIIGKAVSYLAFGNEYAIGNSVDYSSGIVLHKKSGDHVSNGEVLATVYYSSDYRLNHCEQLISSAYKVSSASLKLYGDKSVFIG